MKVIVGLGNIGEKYDKTPHNAGFMFVNKLHEFFEHMTTADCGGCMCAFKGMFQGYRVGDWKQEKIFDAEIAKIKYEEGDEKSFMLVKPTTMMNLAGQAAQKISKKFDFNIENDLFVAYDDLDLELGKYKISDGKYPKDHNGINDVVNKLGGGKFKHIRLGVDNRDSDGNYRVPGEKYVLKEYSEDELVILQQVISEVISNLFL